MTSTQIFYFIPNKYAFRENRVLVFSVEEQLELNSQDENTVHETRVRRKRNEILSMWTPGFFDFSPSNRPHVYLAFENVQKCERKKSKQNAIFGATRPWSRRPESKTRRAFQLNLRERYRTRPDKKKKIKKKMDGTKVVFFSYRRAHSPGTAGVSGGGKGPSTYRSFSHSFPYGPKLTRCFAALNPRTTTSVLSRPAISPDHSFRPPHSLARLPRSSYPGERGAKPAVTIAGRN